MTLSIKNDGCPFLKRLDLIEVNHSIAFQIFIIYQIFISGIDNQNPRLQPYHNRSIQNLS